MSVEIPTVGHVFIIDCPAIGAFSVNTQTEASSWLEFLTQNGYLVTVYEKIVTNVTNSL